MDQLTGITIPQGTRRVARDAGQPAVLRGVGRSPFGPMAPVGISPVRIGPHNFSGKANDAAPLAAGLALPTPQSVAAQRGETFMCTVADIENVRRRGGWAVPRHLLEHAMRSVPEQRESWSCGVHSAARFAAMLGQSIQDFPKFLREGPHYGGSFFVPRIGGNAEKLEHYLRHQNELRGTAIAQRCARDMRPIWDILERALSLGRPIMVMIVESGTSMHWINIVAQDKATGHFFYLDTDGKLYMMSGGRDALMHRMNAGNCLAQKMTFIERYNTVSATEALRVNDFSAFHFDGAYYENRYPDLRKAFEGQSPAQRDASLRRHFDMHGVREGRRAHPSICFVSYVEGHPDLKQAFGTNWEAGAQHYYESGIREGRSAMPTRA